MRTTTITLRIKPKLREAIEREAQARGTDRQDVVIALIEQAFPEASEPQNGNGQEAHNGKA